MADYKKLYSKMFNAVTDAEALISQASRIMRTAQQECEEIYVDADDTPLLLIDKPKE